MPLAVMKLPMLHCDKRHEQEERELDLAEDLEVERLHVDDEIRHQRDLESEGDRQEICGPNCQ